MKNVLNTLRKNVFLVVVPLVLASGLIYAYASVRNLGALRMVTSGATVLEVRAFFLRRGVRPFAHVKAGHCFRSEGRRVPNRIVSGEAEAYKLFLGRRLYVYYDLEGRVEYVFTLRQ